MVVDRHGQTLLGRLLADDVVVQEGLDLLGTAEPGFMLAQGLALAAHAQLELPGLQALVADEGLRPGEQLLYLMGLFAAEGALLFAFVFVHS